MQMCQELGIVKYFNATPHFDLQGKTPVFVQILQSLIQIMFDTKTYIYLRIYNFFYKPHPLATLNSPISVSHSNSLKPMPNL